MELILLGLLLLIFTTVVFIYKNNCSNCELIKLLLPIIMITVIFGLAYSDGDYRTYNEIYDAAVNFSMDYSPMERVAGYNSADIGYEIVNYLFNLLGLAYPEFRLVIITLSLLIVANFSLKLTKNSHVVLLLYALYPAMHDIVQIRTFLVDILVFISLYLYIKKGGFKGKIYFCIFILLAASMHKMAILYLPFLLFDCIYRMKITKILMVFGLMMPLYSSWIYIYIVPMFAQHLNASGGQFLNYVLQDFGIKRYLAYVLVVTLFIIINLNKKNTITDELQLRFVDAVNKMVLYMVCISPVFMITRELSRIPRNLLLPSYLVFAIFLTKLNKKYTKLVMCLYCIGAFAYGYVDYYMDDGGLYFEMMIKNNYLMDNVDALINMFCILIK